MYRIRIRRPDGEWTVGGTRFSKTRADKAVTQLRISGLVAHLDLAEWHR